MTPGGTRRSKGGKTLSIEGGERGIMGLPDDYILPDNSIACHLTGDGVVVPAVRFLADALIELVVLRNRGAG